MARNAEKAMTTLARWRRAQEGGETEKAKRPYLTSECHDLKEAEKWRNQVISEASRKVAQIQNAGLGEFRIRDLNDEINKLLREKGHWELHIRDLGGPDYTAGGPRLFGADGQEVPGNRGYKYFGAAKDLPGVKELFEAAPPTAPRKTRAELMRGIDADYYGLRDDDDGVLIPLEEAEEPKAIAKLIAEHRGKDGENGEKITPLNDPSDERSEALRYMAYVPNVPTQAEMKEYLLERSKQELLKQVLGDAME